MKKFFKVVVLALISYSPRCGAIMGSVGSTLVLIYGLFVGILEFIEGTVVCQAICVPKLSEPSGWVAP